MTDFAYEMISQSERLPNVGIIVLQTDETIESDLRRLLPPEKCNLFVSRVPNGTEVTHETLGAMADEISGSAQLFPRNAHFKGVAYCCTSGTSVIGVGRIGELVKQGCDCDAVTEPVSSLVDACRRRNISRIAFLSPYTESVSAHLRSVLAEHGIESPVFGSFNEANDSRVAWIDRQSIVDAAKSLGVRDEVEAVFMSCTNLKTIDLLDEVSQAIGKPVMSSNSVLAENLLQLVDK